MVTYFLTIDHVLSNDPKVLTRAIPTMERAQWLFGTLEVISDCQPLLALRIMVIIEHIKVVRQGTVSKYNNIKIELTMNEKYCRPTSVYKELTFSRLTMYCLMILRCSHVQYPQWREHNDCLVHLKSYPIANHFLPLG
jgi:hypothetical protein